MNILTLASLSLWSHRMEVLFVSLSTNHPPFDECTNTIVVVCPCKKCAFMCLASMSCEDHAMRLISKSLASTTRVTT